MIILNWKRIGEKFRYIEWLLTVLFFYIFLCNESNKQIDYSKPENYLNDLSITGFSYGCYSYRPPRVLVAVELSM